MYQISFYDTRTARLLKPKFNSLEGAVKFLKEKLNDKDVQQFIAHLRQKKRLDQMNYAQSEVQLYPLYGDVDRQLPSLTEISGIVHRTGSYEYRLGTLHSSFIKGFKCVHFKISPCVDNVSQRVSSEKANQLNNAWFKPIQEGSDQYSRTYHD